MNWRREMTEKLSFRRCFRDPRMVLRPRPDPGAPFAGSRMSAEDLYKRIWRLNILWMGAFNGLIMQNVSDVPGSTLDRMRGGVPVLTFLIWVLLQRDALGRRDNIESVLTDWKKRQARMKESLPQGLKKSDPFYRWGYHPGGADFPRTDRS